MTYLARNTVKNVGEAKTTGLDCLKAWLALKVSPSSS
jgi:hypothetical protein